MIQASFLMLLQLPKTKSKITILAKNYKYKVENKTLLNHTPPQLSNLQLGIFGHKESMNDSGILKTNLQHYYMKITNK